MAGADLGEGLQHDVSSDRHLQLGPGNTASDCWSILMRVPSVSVARNR
jgi:hypothetical protein